ncbi:MAG: D-glycerate dehydrogenase [Peptococcaceae bacterium]|nr:D-glycerate dehydrogenase [Peptococcaceae bacterium]
MSSRLDFRLKEKDNLHNIRGGNMKPRVFITRLIPDIGIKKLQEVAEVKVWSGELPPPREVLMQEVKEVDGLVSLLTDKIDGELMDAGKNLKVISNYAVGFDNIDLDAATQRGLLVTNTPGVLTETTADLAFALLLATARSVVWADKFTREGKWKTWEPLKFLGQDIYGAQLGLLGFGRIGCAVAKRARGFDMKVKYYDLFRNEQAEKELGVEYASIDEILTQSDFISLHVPLTKDTRHLINKDSLKKMKKNAVIINTARGPIINEDDLYEALVNGTIWAAGLDVMDPEPPRADHPLFKLDNVIVLPHIASASIATRNKMALMAAENMIAGLRGEIPPNLVNTGVLRNN